MSLPKTTDILVIGAGPAGLACALSLRKEGCENITVVDAITHGESFSRATVIQPSTLDSLDSLGCVEPFLKYGKKCDFVTVVADGQFFPTADYKSLSPHTKFPFLIIIPQHSTEAFLGDKLREEGVTIIRPLKVTDMHRSEIDPQCTDVVFEDGQVVRARCVVGADGARSTIRASAGIGYSDPDGLRPEDSLHMVFADVTFASPPAVPENDVCLLVLPTNVVNISPFEPNPKTGERVYRLGISIPPGMDSPPPNPPMEYFQSLIDACGVSRAVNARGAEPMKITRALGTSRFRTSCGVADKFFVREGGAVMLVGDAAHKHSPAGGQGMNLGISDAVSLGPVLATYLAGLAQSKVAAEADVRLEQWASSRRARAIAVIHISKQVLGFLTVKTEVSWALGFIPVNKGKLRNLLMGMFSRVQWIQTAVSWRLSGLAAEKHLRAQDSE